MRHVKSSGMIYKLFLLRYGIDFSDTSPPLVATKVKKRIEGSRVLVYQQTLAVKETPALFKRHQEEKVERGSSEGYERNDGEKKSRKTTQNNKKDTHLHYCR